MDAIALKGKVIIHQSAFRIRGISGEISTNKTMSKIRLKSSFPQSNAEAGGVKPLIISVGLLTTGITL